MRSVKKELKIFRGSYEEIMAQPTEDMTIYLSWDTQEIFVGNAYGVKTPYIGGTKLTEREVRELVNQLTDAELSLIRSQLATINVVSTGALNTSTTVNERLDQIEANLDQVLEEKIDAIISDGGILEGKFTTEEEAQQLITQTLNTTTSLQNYYTKTIVDSKFPVPAAGLTFPIEYGQIKTRVTNLENEIPSYSSIKIISGIQSENELASLIKNSGTLDGIYRFQSNNGYELLNKNGLSAIRISPNGFSYSFDSESESWTVLPPDPGFIKSINGITTENNSIEFTVDDIIETSTKKMNNLMPSAGNLSINPLGRNTSNDFSVGQGSIAFGYNSVAQGTSSVSIGYEAVSLGNNSIQLGKSGINNSEADSFMVWEHKLLDKSTGKIPAERMPETFNRSELTIQGSSWNGGTSTAENVTVQGINSQSIIWVSPKEETLEKYVEYGIRAVSQGENFITFFSDKAVSSNVSIQVNIVWRNE
jgi:hypothetical protein